MSISQTVGETNCISDLTISEVRIRGLAYMRLGPTTTKIVRIIRLLLEAVAFPGGFLEQKCTTTMSRATAPDQLFQSSKEAGKYV